MITLIDEPAEERHAHRAFRRGGARCQMRRCHDAAASAAPTAGRVNEVAGRLARVAMICETALSIVALPHAAAQ